MWIFHSETKKKSVESTSIGHHRHLVRLGEEGKWVWHDWTLDLYSSRSEWDRAFHLKLSIGYYRIKGTRIERKRERERKKGRKKVSEECPCWCGCCCCRHACRAAIIIACFLFSFVSFLTFPQPPALQREKKINVGIADGFAAPFLPQ